MSHNDSNTGQQLAESEQLLAADFNERKGWATARTIAATVEPGVDHGGDRRSEGFNAPDKCVETGKVSIRRSAKNLRMGQDTIRSYLKAWNRAAEDGLVTPAADLTPADARTADLPDADWTEYYVSTNTGTTGGDIKGRLRQQPEPTPPPVGSPEVREFVREAIKSDPSVAATADQALEDRTKENVPPRKEAPESNRDHHQYELAALMQVRKIRRESKALASMVHDLDGTAREAVTTTLAECIDVLEIVKSSLQGEESMDAALAALLNEEG